MTDAVWAVVPSVMLMVGTIIAGYFTLRSSRRKVDSTSSNELALAIMINQTTRVAALEAAQKVTADIIEALQKENIALHKEVAEQDIVIKSVKKLEQDKVELIRQLSVLFEGTLVNIEQIVSLGEVPKYTPTPILRGAVDIDPDDYEWIPPRFEDDE